MPSNKINLDSLDVENMSKYSSNIFPSDANEIRNFCVEGDYSYFNGDLLEKLYNRIQKHGVEIETNVNKLEGLKAYEFAPKEWIVIKRSMYRPNKFFPCKMETIRLVG